jgi:Zn-dependent peptidase ImmA (M78 family)
MSSEYYEARPKSIEDIRNLANALREVLRLDLDSPIDFTIYLDLMSIMFRKEHFNYVVLEDTNEIFKSNDEAHTNIKTGTIYIKESVFKKLDDPSSRSHFTIAHELGHFFLHFINGPVLSRKTKPDKQYERPEWQADQFAAELLMPYDAVKYMSAVEIFTKYNVSYKAAETRYKRINKKRL